jgi:hypothetical protein
VTPGKEEAAGWPWSSPSPRATTSATSGRPRGSRPAPGRTTGGYYINAAQAGEPPGPWWGLGAQALGFISRQVVERRPYDAVYQQVDPRTGDKLGRARGRYATFADHLAQLKAAEPHAIAERVIELERDERFVEEGLRRRLQAADSTIRVIGQEQRHLDVENRLTIKPDIVVRRGPSAAFVLDSKYILPGDGTTHVDHHAQLLSYAIRHDIKDVALVYVLDPSLAAPATDLVTTIRHAGIRIHSWSLDLTREPAQIETGMDDLAERVLNVCLHPEEGIAHANHQPPRDAIGTARRKHA